MFNDDEAVGPRAEQTYHLQINTLTPTRYKPADYQNKHTNMHTILVAILLLLLFDTHKAAK